MSKSNGKPKPAHKRPQPHPAAGFMPLMTNEEQEYLTERIQAVGLLEPIVLLDGLIIDGRNREIGCRRAGVKPRYVAYTGATDPESLENYVLCKGTARRNLSRPVLHAIIEAKLRKDGAAFDRPIAREIGCCHRTVGRARRRLEATGAIAPRPMRVGPDRQGHSQSTTRADAPPAELPTQDYAGQPIPVELRKKFACSRLAALARGYRAWVRELGRDYNAVIQERAENPHLKSDAVLAGIQAARCALAEAAGAIEAALPFAVCQCSDGCANCKGSRVLSKSAHRLQQNGAAVVAVT